jgi:hypothetical protein
MSETLVPELRAALVLGAGARTEPRVRRPRRRTLRLKARIAEQEQELLRRQHTSLHLASEVRSLRAALDATVADRARLAGELAELAAVRARETGCAARLVEAVLDQQTSVRELERAVASILASHA